MSVVGSEMEKTEGGEAGSPGRYGGSMYYQTTSLTCEECGRES